MKHLEQAKQLTEAHASRLQRRNSGVEREPDRFSPDAIKRSPEGVLVPLQNRAIQIRTNETLSAKAAIREEVTRAELPD